MNNPWHYLIIPYKEGLVTEEFLRKQTKERCIDAYYKETAKTPSHYVIRLTYGNFIVGKDYKQGYQLKVTTEDKEMTEQLRGYVEDWLELERLPAGSTLDLDPSIEPRQWMLKHIMEIPNDLNVEPLIE